MIDALFAAIAAMPPSTVAVKDACAAVTYAQLLDRIVERATRLAHEGVRVLGSRLDNGCEWIVTDLAALHAGVVHVPIPSFFTSGQQQHVMRAAGVDALIEPAPSGGVRLRALPAPPSLMPPGTAKVTFTSGTTGEPKGVCLSAGGQLAVAGALVAATSSLGIERHLCALPLPVLLENVAGMLAPLLKGATTIALPITRAGLSGSSTFDPGTLQVAVEAHGAQSVVILPEMLRAWVAWLRGTRTSAPKSLRLVAVGGAAVGKDAIVAARAAGLPAYEGYGLSEGGSVQTLNLPGSDRPGSVGRALSHAEIRVGEDGEIEIAGTLFLGYLDGDGRVPPGTWWRTGDLGSIDADGFVHLRGRKDAVLVTGYGRNVSPEWIESLLHAQPCVARAVVLGAGRPRLGAVLWPVAADVSHEDLDAAVARANALLPDYAQVTCWTRSHHDFGTAAGLATANGRPRRHRIAALYCDDLFTPMEHP